MQDTCPFPEAARAAGAPLRAVAPDRKVAWGWAPGRVNLIGEHVDYCGGFVLPAAIDRGTVAAAAFGEPGRLRAVSREQPDWAFTVPLGVKPGAETPPWGRYVAGVVYELHRAGVHIPGLDLAVASDVPTGAGLSSSAALEVAVAMAVLRLAGRHMDALDIATLCQRAEREHAGVPCGIMDQYAAVFGRAGAALLIDCHHLSHRYVHVDAAAAIVVIDSGVKHDLVGGEYAQRRAACERGLEAARKVLGPRPTLRHVKPAELALLPGAMGEVEFRRVRHVVSECERTVAAADALERGDLPGAGRLMYESHASLRDDFEVSCAELDEIVEQARATPGVFGARMTGGGFGGSAVALVEAARATDVVRRLESSGRRCFEIRPGEGAGASSGEAP